MTTAIERLRAMARDAREEYNAEVDAGGDPAWPSWIDDAETVCATAESATQARDAVIEEVAQYIESCSMPDAFEEVVRAFAALARALKTNGSAA